MTSKRTFEAVAAQFYKSRPWSHGVPEFNDKDIKAAEYHAKCVQFENDVVGIADVFTADNPGFDRIRFYRACGLEVR